MDVLVSTPPRCGRPCAGLCVRSACTGPAASLEQTHCPLAPRRIPSPRPLAAHSPKQQERQDPASGLFPSSSPSFSLSLEEGHWIRGGLRGKERRTDWTAGPRSEGECSLLLTSRELLGMAPRNSSPKLVSTPTPREHKAIDPQHPFSSRHTTVTLAKTKQAPQTNTDTHLTVTDTRTSTHICTLAAGYWRLPVCGAKGFFIQGPISSFVATPQS